MSNLGGFGSSVDALLGSRKRIDEKRSTEPRTRLRIAGGRLTFPPRKAKGRAATKKARSTTRGDDRHG